MTYLDTLDVACELCNATYTASEQGHICTFADCPSCGGRGWTNRGDEWLRCIGCRMKAEALDRIRAAAEDRVESAYRDAGFDAMSPLEQWHADGAR